MELFQKFDTTFFWDTVWDREARVRGHKSYARN